jgi:hypothetical protein
MDSPGGFFKTLQSLGCGTGLPAGAGGGPIWGVLPPGHRSIDTLWYPA